MKRRDFLVSAAGLAGTAMSGVSWGAPPCPPPLLSAGGGTSASTGCGSGQVGLLPTLVLVSGSGSGTRAWTFGQPFIKGAVTPGGIRAQSGASAFQAEVRNLWDDGSVKYAVLSGISSFSGSSVSIVLGSGGTLTSGSAVAEPDVQASVQFSSPAVTVELATARANGPMSWNRATAHRVRTIPGPVMSEFHYYAPVPGDAHLAVWWFVRAYSNGAVEVETLVENGWLLVASPGQRNYTVAVSVGGSQRYTGSLSHRHHTRWSRSDWVGSDPAIVPKHDGAYLRATRLVPNYGYTNPTSAAWSDNSQVDTWDAPLNNVNPPPFAQGNFPYSMGDYGYHESIGLMSRLEALYVTSQHEVAYRSMIGNARCYGRYNLHYRDETTGRPFRLSQPSGNASLATTLGMNSALAAFKYGFSDAPTYTPAPSGSAPPTYTPSHAPAAPYLPYLVTGRWLFLEQVQFSATAHWLITQSSRQGASGVLDSGAGAMQTRGAAWSLRSLSQAACITPDGDALQSEFRSSVGANANWYSSQYVGGAYSNGLGMVYNSPNELNSTRPWMNDFLVAVVGWTSDMELLSNSTGLIAFRNWLYRSVTGRVSSSGYCYQDAAAYSHDVSGSTTWAQVYQSNYSGSACSTGGALRGAYYPQGMQMSYWGNLMPALSYAVDHDAPGAATGWALLTGASNWASGIGGYQNNPTWGVVPR